MVRTLSSMLPLGITAPDFSLPDIRGNKVSLNDFQDAPALLVIFMCNHCPFVIHVREKLVELVKKYQQAGVAVVAINSNDVENYPEDSPAKMAEYAHKYGYTFPYLYDQTQEVARSYDAACTPDFFLFDKERSLVYRGQMDDSRPNSGIPVTGTDLTAAIEALLAGKEVPPDQKPSMGCNIKWKNSP